MENYLFIVGAFLVGILFGFLLYYFILRKKKNGTVVIERTEDRERERVRFVIDMDLDEMKNRKFLLFKIENNLS